MFKLKFFGRKKNQLYPSETSTPCIKLSGRNYDELKFCDTTIKIWLSEEVETKINEMCYAIDTTASDIIRQVFFIHLYGRYDLFGLIERQDQTFHHNKGARWSVLNSQISEKEEQTYKDKHVADIKIWIPKLMKADLQMLADKASKKLSVYAREVIITHLFGSLLPADISPNMLPPHDWSEEGESNGCLY